MKPHGGWKCEDLLELPIDDWERRFWVLDFGLKREELLVLTGGQTTRDAVSLIQNPKCFQSSIVNSSKPVHPVSPCHHQREENQAEDGRRMRVGRRGPGDVSVP